MRAGEPLLAVALVLLPVVPSFAFDTLLDDSRSPRQQLQAEFEWTEDRLRAGARESRLFQMQARVNGVEYRLDTSAHVGQRVRIFLEFPRDTAGLDLGSDASIGWRARGNFADGAVEQGGRALVFDGLLETAELHAVLDYTVTLDARDLTGPLRLAPQFVLETQ